MESGPMTPLCLAPYAPFGLAQYHRNRHLSTDCSHVYNAIYCDYFITNDIGLLTKANILYYLFQVNNIRILSIDDLPNWELANEINPTIDDILAKVRTLTDPVNVPEGVTYNLKYPFLFYFDTVLRERLNINTYYLYCQKDYGKSFIYKEVLFIINRIVNLLGPDITQKEVVSMEELISTESGKHLRKWITAKYSIFIVCSDNQSGILIKIVL